MHSESLVRVSSRLKGTANSTHLHVPVLCRRRLVQDSFYLCLLFAKLLDLAHDLFSFFNLLLFTESLSLLVKHRDLVVNLLHLLIKALLLLRVDFRRTELLFHRLSVACIPMDGSVLGTGETTLDLKVDLRYQLGQELNEFILIDALEVFPLGVRHELFFQEVVVALFTRTNVPFRVRKQIVRTERKQVELANVRVIKMISFRQPDKERFIPVLAHKLVELLPNVVHLSEFNQI